MSTKAGRIRREELKAGRLIWKAELREDGTRYPKPVLVAQGLHKHLMFKNAIPLWAIHLIEFDAQGARQMRKILAFDPKITPHDANGLPIFDKFFATRRACERWIKRRQSNRLATLTEDRRSFPYGDKRIKRLGLDLTQIHEHRFTALEMHAVDLLLNPAIIEHH